MAKRKPTRTKNTTFELFAPYNQSVDLIGSWDEWKPIPMTKDDKGMWRVDVPLADGEYQYKFRSKNNSC